MRSALFSTVTVALVAAQLCAAQTFTTCNPTEKTCPPDKALGTTITVDFRKGASSEFNLAEGTTLTYDPTNGAVFTINTETEAPTITSNWYIFFGKVDVVLRAAPGQGIVSSFVMESDDLDEIDLEWLGGDTTQVETNYFGKGNTTTYDRATYVSVATPQDIFHTYTIDWTAQATNWYVDGNLIRTLEYSAANGGSNYPQTPMQVKMGNWVGGSSTSPPGTVEWAGGLANMADAPFNMYVQQITIQDYSTGGAEYVYSDMSGSWQSIKIEGGSSDSTSGSSSSIPPSDPSSTPPSTPSSTPPSTPSSTPSSTSSSSSSGSSISVSKSATTASTTKASTSSSSATSASSFSTVTTVPVASGPGLGAGAVTASASSNTSVTSASITVAATTAASASSKTTGNAGAVLKAGSSYSMAVFGLVLGYLVI